MNHSFWTNTIWYVGLFSTSVMELAIIFSKTHDWKKIFAFFFAVLGFAYWLEAVLVLILNAYTYYPMITPGDRFFDTVLGNIFSQVSVSSSAVLVCVMGLSNWWLFGISVVYFFIGILFSGLGLYEYHWYRSVYTIAGFLIFGRVVQYWFRAILNYPSKKIFSTTLFLSVFGLTSNLLNTSLKLLNIRIFRSGLFPLDPSRDHTATALIYGPVLTVISIALYKWKTHWIMKGFIFLLLLMCQYGLVYSGVMIIKQGWLIFVLFLDLIGYYGWTIVMDRSLTS